MARLPRLYAPHTLQLAQARLARPLATAQDPTPAATLDLIQDWLAVETRQHRLALHGWVILPDRFLILATPPDTQAIPRTIQGVGRRMAARLVHGRVFDARYRSTLVEDAWALRCLAWLESLPVHDGLVDLATRWPWSSAREHVGQPAGSSALTDHAAYWDAGNTPFARQAHHRALLEAGVGRHDHERIEHALAGQWALGDASFIEMLKLRASRRPGPGTRGRPRKADNDNAVTN